jgi:hypothetical protein
MYFKWLVYEGHRLIVTSTSYSDPKIVANSKGMPVFFPYCKSNTYARPILTCTHECIYYTPISTITCAIYGHKDLNPIGGIVPSRL